MKEIYDFRFMQSLIEDEGLNPFEAVLVASTEMDGVCLNEKGDVHDRRVACHVIGSSCSLRNLCLLTGREKHRVKEIFESL